MLAPSKNVTQGQVAQFGVPLADEDARFGWYGYDDYRRGLGFRKDYVNWEDHAQENYERGRQYAAAIQGEWGVVPEWDPAVFLVDTIWHKTKGDRDTLRAMGEVTAYFNAGLLPMAKDEGKTRPKRKPVRCIKRR
jgi:hypothetical protein